MKYENYELFGDMPDRFDLKDPETWVKEDPDSLGGSTVVAIVGEIVLGTDGEVNEE